ncbi:pectin methylesterase-like acyl-CoA thioesterase/lysophospholipase L1-like esterase [Paenibacillus sp. V4I3]|uniref:pectinesterase family protein n=1 Tax=Paenibacillus sp. V4I3 TaxID=3042305 RepID=UPI00277DA70D|nr:pectinesterase family protein [Paenibacillus sp. V4I3]MDQ0871556.1 pectin methylesterase-like acyl-CoA thioesterase/lysophospholipase L1-like esterase [Paenibacillus sp. V4I3]
MNRLLKIGLAALLLTASFPQIDSKAAAAVSVPSGNTALINDDFNGVTDATVMKTTNPMTTVAGYTPTITGANSSIGITRTGMDGGEAVTSDALLLRDLDGKNGLGQTVGDGSGSTAIAKSLGQNVKEGILTIEQDMYFFGDTTVPNGTNDISRGRTVLALSGGINDANRTTDTLVQVDLKGGRIAWKDSTGAFTNITPNSVSNGVWYHLKAVVNFTSFRADYYVTKMSDGTVIGKLEGQPFSLKTLGAAPTDYAVAKSYSATTGGTTAQNILLDNIIVYKPNALPDAPVWGSLTPYASKVKLLWKAAKNAESYSILRGTTSGGPYTTIASGLPVTQLDYYDSTVTNDTTYYYKISSVNTFGNNDSVEQSVTPTASAALPQPPANIAVVARDSAVSLSWSQVSSASQYTLKRSTSLEGPYTTLSSTLPYTQTSYYDSGLTNGTTYYYTLASTAPDGTPGNDSAPVVAKLAAPFASPANVIANVADSQVAISWEPVSGAAYYTVKRSTNSGGPYATIAANVASEGYTDVTAVNGTIYYYVVSASNGQLESMNSIQVAASPASIAVGAPAAPDGVAVNPGNNKVALQWNPVPGAASYSVKRAVSFAGPYTVLSAGLTGTNANDDTALNGTTYYYIVAATSANGEGAPSKPAIATPASMIVVAKDGTGDFTSIQNAVNSIASNNTVRTVIFIKNGVYKEKILVNKPYVSLVGQSRDGTVLTYDDYACKESPTGTPAAAGFCSALPAGTLILGTGNSYSVSVTGTNFTADSLTIQNTAYPRTLVAPAVALSVTGDRAVFTNVKVLGFQDTLYANSGRQYYKDVIIEGDGDYIFGNAKAVFDRSEIKFVGKAGGHITAASTDATAEFGYVFLNSRLTRGTSALKSFVTVGSWDSSWDIDANISATNSTVDLGRPWRPYANVKYINSWMDAHIKAIGWDNWGSVSNEATARYGEYNSSGPGANAKGRFSWTRQLTASEANEYTPQRILAGADGWEPTLISMLPGQEAPQALSAPGGVNATAGNGTITLNWSPVAGAAYYSVQRSTTSDGSFTAIAGSVYDTTYTDVNVMAGQTYYYTVAANNADGQSAPSETVSSTIKGSVNADISVLHFIIVNAEAAVLAAVEGTGTGQYPSGAKATFQSAIQTAKAVESNGASTQQEINQAALELNKAIQNFSNTVNFNYDPMDVNKDGEIGIADLGWITAHYGKSSADSDWDLVKAGDINLDGKIDNQDLMVIANLIQNVPDKVEQITYKFNFTNTAKDGYSSVVYGPNNGAPLYNSSVGYGFVNETSALPARQVHTAPITSDGTGFVISEPQFYAEKGFEKDNYNNYGMAFRIKAPPGAYQVYVKTTSAAADTTVSVSGMQTSRLLKGGYWDTAKLVPIRNFITASGKEWTYNFINGRSFIDIEIEPNKTNTPVGVQEIVLTPIAPQTRAAGSLPTIYTLGDSTVKSYTFDETPMSGWGQVFDNMFDLSKVNVVNYSMGGRSFKSAYTEGRFNDILMTGKVGDYVMFQFGHNDESTDENRRFGRGATEAMYESYIKEVYVPAIRARGMIPVLVTPMSRVNGAAQPGSVYTNSFKTRLFPDIMKKAAEELGVTVVDLNSESLKYYNAIGVEATTAIVMSIEAGETPGKTNDGSYANGHPSNKIDGTHYKEALGKQFARIIVTEIAGKGAAGDPKAANIASFLKQDVKAAIAAGDWSNIFPEMAKDTTTGAGSYYRNQIEKLLQLGVMSKDSNGNFNPDMKMSVGEFVRAISSIMDVDSSVLAGYANGELTREVMGAILDDAYRAKFGTTKPKYMTDYNGTTAVPGSPNYDPNLDSGAKGAMYYPLVSFEQLTDTADISPVLVNKVKDAYELGLIRSEKGIARGKMINGTELEPKMIVARAKAAKTLYFMWVLVNEVNVENDFVKAHIDNVAPTATVGYSTTAPTNQDVVATITPSEAVTVINNGGSTSYTFTANGSFTFEFMDAAGNKGSVEAAVYNIDKIAPTATVAYSTTAPTNQAVVATITPSEAVTVINNGGSTSYTFTDNGSFTFEFMDAAGNKGSVEAAVYNIDKIAPTATVAYSTTAPTNQAVVATITPSEAVTVINNGGSTSYTFTANGSFTFEFVDAAGNVGSATATVSNIDTIAPTLILIPDKQTLSTANHKLVTVSMSVYGQDEGAGVSTIVLTSITSNEPDDGLGDGDTAGDIAGAEIGTFDTEFQLRAERSGKGQGRIYLITYTITDLAGNQTTATAEVTVPHDNK